MKTFAVILFVCVSILSLPCQAQTISLNLIASVEQPDVKPVKVFTLDPGTIVRDYTLISADHGRPVAHKAKTVVTATATARIGEYGVGYAVRARAQPVRRLFGRLFRGRAGCASGACSY